MGSVAVREHGRKDAGSMPIADFVARLREQSATPQRLTPGVYCTSLTQLRTSRSALRTA